MSARKGVDFKSTSKKSFISNKIANSLKKVNDANKSDAENRIDNYFSSVKTTPEIQEHAIQPTSENQIKETSIEGNSVKSTPAIQVHPINAHNGNQTEATSTVNSLNHQSHLEKSTDELQNVKVLQKEIQVLKKNLHDAKLLLRKTNQVNMEKDMQLKKFSTESQPKTTPNHLFGEFSSKFDNCELATIRSVGPGKKNDSRFILNITRFLYKGDEQSKLKNRSVVGRKYNGETKNEISFEKKEIMKTMFKNRVDDELPELKEVIIPNEHSQRMRNLNNLIRSAIHNIVKSVQKQDSGKRARDEEDDDSRPLKHARTDEGIYLIQKTKIETIIN